MPRLRHLVEQRRATAVVESACPGGHHRHHAGVPQPGVFRAAGHVRLSPRVSLWTAAPPNCGDPSSDAAQLIVLPRASTSPRAMDADRVAGALTTSCGVSASRALAASTVSASSARCGTGARRAAVAGRTATSQSRRASVARQSSSLYRAIASSCRSSARSRAPHRHQSPSPPRVRSLPPRMIGATWELDSSLRCSASLARSCSASSFGASSGASFPRRRGDPRRGKSVMMAASSAGRRASYGACEPVVSFGVGVSPGCRDCWLQRAL